MDTQQFDALIIGFGKAGKTLAVALANAEKSSASGAVAKDVWRHLY